jgi:hypothetical protein
MDANRRKAYFRASGYKHHLENGSKNKRIVMEFDFNQQIYGGFHGRYKGYNSKIEGFKN